MRSLLASIVLLLTACGTQSPVAKPDARPPVSVSTVTLVRRETALRQGYSGTVQPVRRVAIQARISGTLQELPIRLGQAMAKDGLIARIESGEIQARVKTAEAQREQTGKQLQRYQQLVKENAVTRQEFDLIEAGARSAAAMVEEAQALLAYATITAPFDGVITAKNVQAGDLAMPGRVLVELADPRLLRLEADVAEEAAAQVKLGDQIPVEVPAAGLATAASVVEIAPAADPASRSVLIKLDLPAKEGLRMGQFGRVRVAGRAESLLTAPATAVVQRGQLELVFVDMEGRAGMRLIKTGRRDGDRVEILSGLGEGESIVVAGAAGLADGQRVEIVR